MERRTRVTVFRTFAVASLVGLVGCYSYQPIEAKVAPVGMEVRARITGAASDRVAPLLGSFDTRILVGSVVENTSGAMLLEVPNGAMPNVTDGVVQLRTRVPIMPSDLVSLERRRLDVGRTVVFGGGIVAAVGLGVALALHSGSDPQPGKLPTDPPPITRVPIGVIRF
jgi:hypothetical protein